MGKFNYRLQSILNLKMKMETLAKQDFSAAMAALNRETDRLDLLIRRKEEYEDRGQELLQDKLTVRDIIENNRSIERMKEAIEEQQARVEKARKKVAVEREKLSEAMKERKVQENLREKAFAEYLQEEKRGEGRETDELTSYRYSRKEKPQ